MLLKLLVVMSIVGIGRCRMNHMPKIVTQRIFDCSKAQVDQTCNVTLVVLSLTTMTYYDITDDGRGLVGYRAAFYSNGTLAPLLNGVDPTFFPIPPIVTDGTFRPVIAINGFMPGPTIIVSEGQRLNITVYNELDNVDGISIHWHGMRQMGTEGADGVAYITQHPIPPNGKYTYEFIGTPAGTHWYHAFSGAQRTDGLYGALIVADLIPGNFYDRDSPSEHTLMLMDWQKETSNNIYYSIGTGVRFWEQSTSNDPPFRLFNPTLGPDNTVVGSVPFWSGIINDKGRHFNKTGDTEALPTDINHFTVTQGFRYRFRLIGAQALYSFRFSIEEHRLTVLATDGSPIEPIGDVNYVIVNPGETYDVVVHTINSQQRNFWIWAETLEDKEQNENETFYSPVDKHRAEAVLRYDDLIPMEIDEIDKTWECTPSGKCIAVNCPFSQYGESINCMNIETFRSLSGHSIPQQIYSPEETMFYSFGLHGERSASGNSVDGVNFRLPTNPPLTEYQSFIMSNDKCEKRGCNLSHCACTQVIDVSHLPRGTAVEYAIVNRDVDSTLSSGTSQPVHLHGHSFYVVDVGYPTYDLRGKFVRANENIECLVISSNVPCSFNFTTIEGEDGFIQALKWRNRPVIQQQQFPLKNTLMVPYGGYAVIRFRIDNRGWWLLHSHIEISLLEGMAIVLRVPQGTGMCLVYHYL